MPGFREVEILNTTRHAPLATRARVADTHATRARGLIGSPPIGEGEALVLDPSMGIHTWFMSYAIDVIYVGSDDRVIDFDHAIRPWRFGRIRPRSYYVIEMAAGAVRSSGLQVGDHLRIMKRRREVGQSMPTDTMPTDPMSPQPSSAEPAAAARD